MDSITRREWEQTMRFARFHPEYGDVEKYFEDVEERLGPRDGEATPHSAPHPPVEGIGAKEEETR